MRSMANQLRNPPCAAHDWTARVYSTPHRQRVMYYTYTHTCSDPPIQHQFQVLGQPASQPAKPSQSGPPAASVVAVAATNSRFHSLERETPSTNLFKWQVREKFLQKLLLACCTEIKRPPSFLRVFVVGQCSLAPHKLCLCDDDGK